MLTTLAAALAVPLLFLAWNGPGRLRHSPWPAVAVLVVYGYGLLHGAAGNVRVPREWDYACFWLYGHIAAAHLNLYDPAVFAHFNSPFTPSDEFRSAVLNVGFPYPPPTIALFLPLGFIDSVPVGLTLWYAAQFAALTAAAGILARTFMPAQGWRSAAFVLAVITALPASLMNVNNAQTNFLLLLLVALALRERGSRTGAVWIALGLWIKPYAAILLLVDLIRGRWQPLLAAGATALVSLLAAALVVGPAAITSYLRANPSAREPSFAYVEFVNQSLLAIVLRMHAVLPAHVSPLHEPLYVAGALLLGGLTVALCIRTPDAGEVAFASMLMLGLIVYPGALSSYGVILIVPLLVLWRNRETFAGGGATVSAIFAVAVALQGEQRGFVANLLVWVACGYLLLAARGTARDEGLVTAGSPQAGAAAVAG